VVLVDSSVWIDLLRDRSTRAVVALRKLLDAGAAALSPVVYQEILQGAASAPHFERLRAYFSTLPFLVPAHPVRSYERAAHLYARCRWLGLTPRSHTDCLIAQTAVDQETALLAHDRDFDMIARAEPRLTLYEAK